MLWILAIVLFGLWLVGLVVKWTLGGLIHILLGVAILMVVLHFIRGRKVA
jgi:hypothetical protein